MSHGVMFYAARRRKRTPRKSKLDGQPPGYLLAVLTQMGRMADVVNREARKGAPKHGDRALKRRAKRRRYAANTRRGELNGWRAFHEEEKRRAGAEA